MTTATMTSLGAINGSQVRTIYRASGWTKREPVRLFVTYDDKIWLGYGDCPERFSHIANVGDRGTSGYTRDQILRAANA